MNTDNPLLCNPEEGICEIPTQNESTEKPEFTKTNKPLKITYFTDPICSSCWGVEPQIRKLKLEYGAYVEISYHMGGLLPDWSYNSGGISKPSDVAHHWDEVSEYYKMPIDGDVWLEDPLHSSYPPSIAFKAAQIQSHTKAIIFLRIVREMVFLKKKNITKWEHLLNAAKLAKLNIVQFKNDYENKAISNFESDLKLARNLKVRGFPTFFITDNLGNQEFIYGFRPYDVFETKVKNMHPNAVKKLYKKEWKNLFEIHPTLTTKEFAELSNRSFEESKSYLNELFEQKKLDKISTKNGTLWINK